MFGAADLDGPRADAGPVAAAVDEPGGDGIGERVCDLVDDVVGVLETNPDGSIQDDLLAVIVEQRTGVVYGNQCAGTRTHEGIAEGYLVPVGGIGFDGTLIDSRDFTAVFHRDSRCLSDLVGRAVSGERLARLSALIENIPMWRTALDPTDETDARLQLRLDHDRLDELAEAWVPVMTPHGRGILIWQNCD